METTSAHALAAEKPRMGARLLRYFARAALAAAVASATLYVVEHQARLVKEEGLLRYPLALAVEAGGVAVIESDLLLTVPLGEALTPSFSELKAIASRIAEGMPQAAPPNLWTDEGDGYRVVYLEGGEPLGGRWIASARFVEGEVKGSGRVEASVHRRFYGMPGELPRLYHATALRLQRGAGAVTPPHGKAILRGRPGRVGEWEELGRRLLEGAGADLRYEELREDRYIAAGWTPRLPGRGTIGRQAVNVIVTVTRRGLSDWVEVETPLL